MADAFPINVQASAFRPVAESVAENVLDDVVEADRRCRWSIAELRNGRERGYCLCVWSYVFGAPPPLRIFFAEQRNADSLFLMRWSTSDSLSADQPTLAEIPKEAWRNQVHVPHLRLDLAYDRLHDMLTEYAEEVRVAALPPGEKPPKATCHSCRAQWPADTKICGRCSSDRVHL